MIGQHGSLVQVKRVRVVRTASFGVFCLVNAKEAEIFVPFAQIYDPPPSRLLPGENVEMAVPVWLAREHKIGGHRLDDPRLCRWGPVRRVTRARM